MPDDQVDHFYATARDVERVEDRLIKLENRINLLFGGLIVVISLVNILAGIVIAPLVATALTK